MSGKARPHLHTHTTRKWKEINTYAQPTVWAVMYEGQIVKKRTSNALLDDGPTTYELLVFVQKGVAQRRADQCNQLYHTTLYTIKELN